MKSSKKLEKVVVLGLLLATVGYGSAGAATYTSGTHDIGGTINVSGTTYVGATGDVTLNANSDVTFSDNGTGEALINKGPSGTTVAVNMNNKNLTFTSLGDLLYNSTNTNNVVKVLNANDIVITQNVVNRPYLRTAGSGNTTVLQANHDIHWVDNVAGDQQPSAVDNGGSLTLNAGHDVYINVYQNPVNLNTGNNTKLDIVAGNDVNLISRGTWSNMPILSNCTLTVTATNGAVNILSTGGNTGSVAVFGANSVAKITAAKDVNIGGNTQRALRSTGGSIDITSNTGTINLTATNTEHSNNAGIYAGKTGTAVGTINLHSDTVIKAVTNGIHADGGKVTFDKAATISEATTAIAASNAGTVMATNAASDKKITGNITSDGSGSSVDANFDTGASYLTGATTVSNDGAINLEFANNGLWNVTGDSSLTNLTNGGIVNMDYTGADKYETITTKNYTGNNGTINFTTDLEKSKTSYDVTQNSDKLIIEGTSTGTSYVTVQDASKISKQEAEGYLLLIEDKASGGANFVGKSLEENGIFKYKPVLTSINPADNTNVADGASYTGYDAGNAKNWYLTGWEKEEELQPAVVPSLATGTERYLNYWRELDNLLLRLGELRDNENADGIWVRAKHGENSDSDMGIDKSKYTMLQLGYDHRYQNDAEKGRRYWGIAYDHILGTQDYDNNADSKTGVNSFTLYDTWLGNKGHYLDLVGRMGRMGRDFNYRGTAPDSGSDSTWYYSLSGEYGRKIQKENGYYWEPQTQLTYGHINGSDYTTDTQGINVSADGINSLVWRLGTTFGRHFGGTEDGKRSNVYAKLFWNREFLGSDTVGLRYDTDTYSADYSHRGNWWTLGLGANCQLDDRTNVYGDFSKHFGGEFSSSWQVNVGLRWSWGKAPKAAVVPVMQPVQHIVPVKETYYDTVYFDFDNDQPKAGEQAKVAKFAETAKANPNVTYAMVGNTDAVGTDTYNMDLSKRRVENVKSAAEKLGVPASRMQDSYLGKSHPAQSNDTAAGRAANRRVEIYEHKADTSTQN